MPESAPKLEERDPAVDYVGAKIETKLSIGVIDRFEDDKYVIKWTKKRTGRSRETRWTKEDLDLVAANGYSTHTITIQDKVSEPENETPT